MLSPFRRRGFFDLENEMRRMFESASGDLEGARHQRWTPAMDAFERDDDLVIKVELAGMKPDDVNVTVRDGVSTISGQRKEDSKARNVQVESKEG